MASPHPPPFPIDTLDYFFPGYTIISRALSSLFYVDVSQYLPLLLVAGLTYTALRYLSDSIYNSLWTYFTSTAEVNVDDLAYDYLTFWLSRQTFANNTRHFVASSSPGRLHYDSDSDDDDDWPGGNESDIGSDEDFDEYWARMNRKNKTRKMIFTPSSTGNHYFWYKNRLFRVSKVREKGRVWTESIHLSCFGRDPAVLKDVLQEGQKLYAEKESHSTVIFQAVLFPETKWSKSMARHPRPLSTVILDKEQKDGFIDDVKDYLHPFTRRWYSNRGIPYRRGYLFNGPPGCGKTSLCFAVAGKLGLKIYVISLNSRTLSEEGLSVLFADLPQKCIVLLEDIDTAGITHTRSKNTQSTISQAGEDNDDKDDDCNSSKDTDKNDDDKNKDKSEPEGPTGKISLSALLNTIDGIASSEGRILVMTTNHVENLDPALLRPGRVDMTITFGHATTQTIKDLFRAIYTEMDTDGPASRAKQAKNGNKTSSPPPSPKTTPKSHRILHHTCSPEEIISLSDSFASVVPAGKFTPAQIQGYLLKHKDTPREAVEGAAAWVKATGKNVAQLMDESGLQGQGQSESLESSDIGVQTPSEQQSGEEGGN